MDKRAFGAIGSRYTYLKINLSKCGIVPMRNERFKKEQQQQQQTKQIDNNKY